MFSGNMCSTFTNKNLDTFTNSDVVSTSLLASITFDKLLKEIQSSNLNFQCQVSPFSAVISLKKSLVKERNGFVRLPPRVTASKESDHTALAALEKRNIKLEEDLENSCVKYDCVVDKLEEANRRNKTIEELNNKQRKRENDKETIAGLV